jgi:crossover junction endodeoxyribonuclease RuvC
MVRIIGLDPGLRNTGWGVIEAEGTRLIYVADGAVHSDADAPLAERLLQIHRQVLAVLKEFVPDEAAIEETFVNMDARATLKLGQARGAVRAGHAEKQQVKHMVKVLLPKAALKTADSTDALAIAITHAHHRGAKSLAAALARS